MKNNKEVIVSIDRLKPAFIDSGLLPFSHSVALPCAAVSVPPAPAPSSVPVSPAPPLQTRSGRPVTAPSRFGF